MSDVSPVITALRAIGAPTTFKELDEQAIAAAINKCPDIKDFLDGSDVWARGAGSALVGIHAAMSDMEHEDSISSITTDDIYKSDGILGENASLLTEALPQLEQYVGEFDSLQETTRNFRAGATCAFFSVYRKHAYTEVEESEVLTREDIKEMEDEGEATISIVQVDESSFQPDVKGMITNLVMAGVDIEDITIKPRFKEDGSLELSISGSLGDKPDFDKIAAINSLFKAYGDGSSVKLVSRDGVIYYEHAI